jgi:transposase InsO family protein
VLPRWCVLTSPTTSSTSHRSWYNNRTRPFLSKRHCAAAESLNSLYKKELIDYHGGWKGVMDVTIATMEWVAWYNSERLHSYCGNVPPAEYEETFHQSVAATVTATENQAI